MSNQEQTEQGEERVAQQREQARECQARARTVETPEQREERLSRQREEARERRAVETSEQREERLA